MQSLSSEQRPGAMEGCWKWRFFDWVSCQKANTVNSLYKNTIGTGTCILIWCLFLYRVRFGTYKNRRDGQPYSYIVDVLIWSFLIGRFTVAKWTFSLVYMHIHSVAKVKINFLLTHQVQKPENSVGIYRRGVKCVGMHRSEDGHTRDSEGLRTLQGFYGICI